MGFRFDIKTQQPEAIAGTDQSATCKPATSHGPVSIRDLNVFPQAGCGEQAYDNEVASWQFLPSVAVGATLFGKAAPAAGASLWQAEVAAKNVARRLEVLKHADTSIDELIKRVLDVSVMTDRTTRSALVGELNAIALKFPSSSGLSRAIFKYQLAALRYITP